MSSSTDELPEAADAGFPAYDAVMEQVEALTRVVGESGEPRAFMVVLDIEADGSDDKQRAVELYVFGNMPAEMVNSVIPMAMHRYNEEQMRGRAGSSAG
jgi:enterochelin esterase-like enzyme